MATWPPDPAARPRSAAARRAILDMLTAGDLPWEEVAERAARSAEITPAFAGALIAAGCRAGEVSWTGTTARAGRTLHLGQVPDAGVARRMAPPRPLAPLPPRVDLAALLALSDAGARLLPGLAALYGAAQGDATPGPSDDE